MSAPVLALDRDRDRDRDRAWDAVCEQYVQKVYDGSIEAMIMDVVNTCRDRGGGIDVRAYVMKHRARFCMAVVMARARAGLEDSVAVRALLEEFN